ncbi:hypothetical protein [Arenicella chitinivorans]|nr:hypothetical protein [Arenicella chitinivorans]
MFTHLISPDVAKRAVITLGWMTILIAPAFESRADPGAGFSCHHWGENAKNVLADYRIRLESGMDNPEAGTKEMVSYENMNEGKTGKLYYDTIFPKVFALVSPETIYVIAKEFCESMPDDAFIPDNFY